MFVFFTVIFKPTEIYAWPESLVVFFFSAKKKPASTGHDDGRIMPAARESDIFFHGLHLMLGEAIDGQRAREPLGGVQWHNCRAGEVGETVLYFY